MYQVVTINFCIDGDVQDFITVLDARMPGDEHMNAAMRHGGSGKTVYLDHWQTAPEEDESRRQADLGRALLPTGGES